MRAAGPRLAACVALLCACSPRQSPPLARSLVLVTIDTLRADHLSAWGHDRSTSPVLDAYLERGVRFRWAFSTAPRTAPSHASLMTGLYPAFHSIGDENGRYRLEPAYVTLAEHCRAAGMRTAAVVSNPVLKRGLGLEQGFETYDDDFSIVEPTRHGRGKVADQAVERARAALETFGDEPFFLWLHLQDPHGPYAPPPEFAGSFAGVPTSAVSEDLALEAGSTHAGLREIPSYQVFGDERQLGDYVRRYDEEIRYADAALGDFLAALDELGLTQGTLVVVTADHGEAFGEDDYFCAHGHGIGLDQTHVPLGFVGPGIPAARTLQAPVSNLDLFATALDALGLAASERMQSTSLLAHLLDGSEPRHVGYAHSDTQMASFAAGWYLRADRRPASDTAFWSLVNPFTRAPRRPLGGPLWSRLDAPRPAERAQGPAGMLEGLDEHRRRAEDFAPRLESIRSGQLELSELDREDLRAMGYLE